jgi:replication fork clamp-binding protein CrfC
MKDPKELEKMEQKLQERLDTLWERQWSKEQQALLESEYPLFA